MEAESEKPATGKRRGKLWPGGRPLGAPQRFLDGQMVSIRDWGLKAGRMGEDCGLAEPLTPSTTGLSHNTRQAWKADRSSPGSLWKVPSPSGTGRCRAKTRSSPPRNGRSVKAAARERHTRSLVTGMKMPGYIFFRLLFKKR